MRDEILKMLNKVRMAIGMVVDSTGFEGAPGRMIDYDEYMDYLSWLKKNKPDEFTNDYCLDLHYDTLFKFGSRYASIFNIDPIKDDHDGYLRIRKDINEMVNNTYKYVIELHNQGNDLLLNQIHTIFQESMNQTTDHIKKNVKEAFNEVLDIPSGTKPLNKKQRFEDDVKQKLQEQKIKIFKNNIK